MGADLVGKTLGHYRIVEKIGEGGMGVVYRATDEKLHRTVAVKVLSDDLTKDDERRRRFLREARIAAGLNHPNIATVHDVGEADGRIYIAMELVEGASLRQRLESGAVPIAMAIGIAKDLTRALVKAHEKGVVHRDLKPDNVMVSDDLVVKVLDFGLAKPLDVENTVSIAALGDVDTAAPQITGEGRVLGTPGYMSPEQTAGRAVDARTDVFALGVVLYEMVTGVRPFRGTSALDVIIATNRDAPEPPSKLRGTLAPEIERIILRCLEKKAESRYATARALLSELDALGAQSDAPAEPTSRKDVGAVPPRSPATTEPRAGASIDGVGAPSPKPRPRAKRWSWLAGGLAIAITAAGAIAVAMMRHGATPQPSSSALVDAATSALVDAAPRVVRIIDLPAPPTNSPEAASAYASGILALHDNSWFAASNHFLRAIALDPSMAAAHMRLSIASNGRAERRVSEYARAVSLRTQLTPRDQALLEALDPWLGRGVQDRLEAARRLAVLIERWPTDVELFTLLGVIREGTPASLAPAERALALDPEDGQSWETKGMALAVMGKMAEAHAAFERCTQLAVNNSDCYQGIGIADAVEGKCADSEREMRRVTDRAPGLGILLMAAMAATDHPEPALRLTAAQAVASWEPADRAWLAAYVDTWFATFAGDFAHAVILAKKAAAEIEAHPTARSDYGMHHASTMMLVDVELETGDEKAARASARDFLARRDAWIRETTLCNDLDFSLELKRLSLPASGEFAAERRAWVDHRLASGVYPGQVWVYAYAATTHTSRDAADALAALQELGPPASMPALDWHQGIPDAHIGHVYLLAGMVDDAIPVLRRAVANCNLFTAPFDHVHAALDLGTALEQKGDHDGACDAYGKVLALWGHATPRCVTADAARARVKALGCAAR